MVARPLLWRAVSSGSLLCFCLAAGAQAQVATRTQIAAQQENGVLSLTATVAGAAGGGVSEGSVSFETAKGSLGSVWVHNGTATLNLTDPPQWAKTVTAVYHGDSAFASSRASTAVAADASGLAGFTVTANPSTISVTPGETGTIDLTITSQNGFSEAVNLSCSGLPGQSTCTFNPAVATPPANGSVLSVMQINTESTSGSGLPQTSSLGGARGVEAILFPGILALAGVGAIRRRNFGALRVLGMALLLGAGVLGLSACNVRYSYEHYKPSPNYGTAAGTYTVIVSAYSSNGTAVTQATSSAGCSGAVCVALTVQ